MKKKNGRFAGQLTTSQRGRLIFKQNGLISTAEVKSNDQQTPLQMMRRITWSNIIAEC